MKIVFLFLLALPAMAQLFPFPGPGSQSCSPTFAFMDHDEAGDPNSATTLAHNTSGAVLIVIAASWFGAAGAITISDSKGNSYTGLTIRTTGGSNNSKLFYKTNPVVGAGHTFTIAGASAFGSLAVLYFSGCTASFDPGIENGATGSGVTSLATGSITPTVNNEVVIAGLGLDGFGTTSITINSGMTPFSLPFLASTNEGVGIAYKIQTSAAAINPTWSWTTNGTPAATIASFKP